MGLPSTPVLILPTFFLPRVDDFDNPPFDVFFFLAGRGVHVPFTESRTADFEGSWALSPNDRQV